MCFMWEVPQVNKGFWFKNLTMLYGESSPSTSQSPHGGEGREQDFEKLRPPTWGWQEGVVSVCVNITHVKKSLIYYYQSLKVI